MIRLQKDGLDYLISWERFEDHPYDDGYGFMTIYFGHKILPGEVLNYTREEGEEIFAKDVEVAEADAAELIDVPVTHNQYIALISILFNVGYPRFKKSKTRKLINNGASKKEVSEFIKKAFITSRGKVSKGLIARRAADAELWLT